MSQEWKGYENYDHAFKVSQLDEFVSEIGKTYEGHLPVQIVGKNAYLDIPASFDIETTSVTDDKGEKHACMYIWQVGIGGSVIYGRTWDEFIDFLKKIKKEFSLETDKCTLVMYVHNLGYEFQWIRKRIPWAKDKSGKSRVFSVKERKPVYAVSQLGIEFRCSYLLSNYSLAYVCSNLLKKYPIEKMVGDLDYSKARHYLSPITEKELGYCLNDVRGVMSYIQEKIENEGGIGMIPLTNTGYVRNYCRQWCMTDGETDPIERKHRQFEYRAIMRQLSIRSEKEYNQLQEAFAGGFTHANAMHSGQLLEKVGSADLTSSYPYTMVAQKFPMSEGCFIGECSLEDLEYYTEKFCCLFTIEFKNIYSTLFYESYISVSKCFKLSDDYTANNGRVATASQLAVTVTELDWDIIRNVYDWDEIKIMGLRIYDKGYLPRPLIMAILQLYKNKTSLKGVSDKEIEYMVSKNMINSAFGMAVTAIVRDENMYKDGNWKKEEADVQKQLISYNKNFNRFLFYAWGVWVTAHARHNLWEAIFEFGDDYVYSDTDSIKGLNFDKHLKFFEDYNNRVAMDLLEMCAYYKIPSDMVRPKTKNGESKTIGLWDIEKPYARFKTLGAKRYMYEYETGELGMTVSGVNKKYAIPYLLSGFSNKPYKDNPEWKKIFETAYSPDPRQLEESKVAMKKILAERKAGKLDYSQIFEVFRKDLYIPAGHTGKQSLTYLDKKDTFWLTDYEGNRAFCSELSAIHMEPAGYYFSITKEYMDFINGIQDGSN